MPLPDTPNFSPIARVVMGVLAVAVIFLLLRYLGVV
jgi:hypothetical protein